MNGGGAPKARLAFVVESGTDVRMVDGLAEYFDVTVLARRIKGGVEISRPPTAPVRVLVGPARRVRFAWWAARKLSGHDVVLVQGYGLAALAANLSARFTGRHTAMLVCSPVELYYEQRRENPVPGKPYRRRELRAIKRVARLNAKLGRHYVVLSEHLQDVVRGHGARCPVHVIPVYGVDTMIFCPARYGRVTLRERLHLPVDGTLVIFSSRVAPEKDARTLLAAVSKLVKMGHNLRLLNLSGGYRDFLALAEQFGLGDRVIAADAVHPTEELPTYYQAADLCVQASREEGLGFSPLEALACAIPVVAAAVGGLRESILRGQTGWTYSVGYVDGLVKEIADVLDHPDVAFRLASSGRAMVMARYERSDAFKRLAEVLTPR